MVVEVTQQRIFCSWPFYCQAAAAAACQQRVPDCVRKWTPAITVLVHAHRLAVQGFNRSAGRADVNVQKATTKYSGRTRLRWWWKKRSACRSVRWTGLDCTPGRFLFQLQSSESEAVVVAC